MEGVNCGELQDRCDATNQITALHNLHQLGLGALGVSREVLRGYRVLTRMEMTMMLLFVLLRQRTHSLSLKSGRSNIYGMCSTAQYEHQSLKLALVYLMCVRCGGIR